ncbi:MAG: hypothetical protein EXR43_05785 [Dehalococcoidia bacterium]|nr:hypothetical protein [Dehalococcoidia bacterium]
MTALACPHCGANAEAAERACRACDGTLRQAALPVIVAPMRLVLWRGARPGLIQGAALAVTGLALRYALRHGTGLALRQITGGRIGGRKRQPVEYMSETHIVKRVWMRR